MKGKPRHGKKLKKYLLIGLVVVGGMILIGLLVGYYIGIGAIAM